MNRPRVAYWTHQPTPYTVDRWNAVIERGNIDLVAWFDIEREFDRSWQINEKSWMFEGIYLKKKRVLGREFYLPSREQFSVPIDLVIQEYGHPSAALGFFVNRVVASRVAFRFLPTHATWFERTRSKEAVKHFLFRSVDGVKTAGPDGLAALEAYAVPKDRRHVVTQSIDVEHFATATDVSPAWREARRREFGLTGCVFMYVGRVWERKGLDTLFEAYGRMQVAEVDTSLFIVGDGVDEDRYRALADGLPNVTFAGYVQKEDLPAHYALADVFVFPTLGDPHGLVVDEAMVAGLPVISSSAAGDIRQRIPEGEAGFVVPPGDPDALVEPMVLLAADPKLRRSMSRKVRALAEARTPARYAEDFEKFVFSVIEKSPRRNISALVSRSIGTVLRRVLL